jgi:hypothetical protein
MKKSLGAIALIVSTLLLGACGSLNGFISAQPEAKKLVDAGEYVPEAVAQVAIFQHPDFNGGKLPLAALRKIQQLSMSCQGQADGQVAGPGQSAATGAGLYGVAGTGTGPAAALAFGSAGNMMGKYATYGGIAYLLPGAVNGLYSGSYAMASVKGTCTVEFWRLTLEKNPEFKGTVVVPVLAGKSSNSAPPTLERKSAPASAVSPTSAPAVDKK